MRWVVEIEAGAALLFVYLANAQLRAPFSPAVWAGQSPVWIYQTASDRRIGRI